MNSEKGTFNAWSTDNGIAFASERCPFLAIKTYYDEENAIQYKIVGSDTNERVGNRKWKLWKTMLCAMIISCVLGILTKSAWVTVDSFYFIAVLAEDFFEFAKWGYDIWMPNGKRKGLSKFHGAEHMVVNAYTRVKRIPKLDEVKKESRFHKSCGSRFIINRTVQCFLIFLALIFIAPVNSVAYAIAVIGIFYLMKLAEKYSWFRFLQVFFTRKPTERELKLAIVALRNKWYLEAYLKEKNE